VQYLTDRKRANALGAARTGTVAHWGMTKSAVGLLILLPFFLFTFGSALGLPYEEARAYYARPFPALVAALMIVAGFLHFKNGVMSAIEDYTHGVTREILVVLTTCLSYGAAAAGLLALVRLAL